MDRYDSQNRAPYLTTSPTGEWVRYEDVRRELGDKCACCGEVGHDHRTLWMACGYNMDELGIPLDHKDVAEVTGFNRGGVYTLLVCKHCRALWLDAIKVWFEQGGDR